MRDSSTSSNANATAPVRRAGGGGGGGATPPPTPRAPRDTGQWSGPRGHEAHAGSNRVPRQQCAIPCQGQRPAQGCPWLVGVGVGGGGAWVLPEGARHHHARGNSNKNRQTYFSLSGRRRRVHGALRWATPDQGRALALAAA